MSTFDLQTYKLMHEHAMWSYRPSIETEGEGRVKCALALARAAYALARDVDVYIDWERDLIEPDAWCCLLCSADGEVMRALGGVDFADDGTPFDEPYARVIEAELYQQHLDRIEELRQEILSAYRLGRDPQRQLCELSDLVCDHSQND